jgi:outer membrane protein OmpA-like peptidoglycan-associated protein
VKVLTEYKSLRLQIDGHTDNQGKPDMNKKLSEDRAASVKTYLVSKGVDEGRLVTAGYGDTKPVEDNKTPKGRAANRRIEFAVLGQ